MTQLLFSRPRRPRTHLIVFVLAVISGWTLTAQDATDVKPDRKPPSPSDVQTLSLGVLEHLRDRDVASALTTLAAAVDQTDTIGELVHTPLPSAAAGLHRSLWQQSPEEQYAALRQWTMPDDTRNFVRLLSAPVPSEAPPKVFARSLRERPRDTTFAVASVGPYRGLFCSGWMLVRAADQLGRLPRLRVELEALSDRDVEGSDELLMLANLAGNRGDLDRVNRYLESLVPQEQTALVELQVIDVHRAVVAVAATLHPETQAASENVLQSLVTRGEAGLGIVLRPLLRFAHAIAVQAHHGTSPPESLFDHRLKHWLPTSVLSRRDLERGQAHGIWLTHERHILHLAGGGTDVLWLRYPVVGEFDFICQTQEGGSIGTDGGLVYGGLHFQALGRKDQLTVWDADHRHSLTRPSPFARSGSEPVFNRVSIRSRTDGCQFESNFHPVWFDDSSAQSSPWIGLRSSGTQRPVFRNIRLTGNPVIPREVSLISGDQLRGWQANFFEETIPAFREARRENQATQSSAQSDAPAPPDWTLHGGTLTATASPAPEQAARQGLLRYHRPLLAGETIRYEFAATDGAPVHPAVGRLAFLLEPTGIRVRWITNGASEWTGLDSDNAALEPLNRRGPRPLPLSAGQWNSVAIHHLGDKLQIALNDQTVYERPVDPDDHTSFGLYRADRTADVQVRNVVLSGDWPDEIPEDLVEVIDE